MSSFPMQVKALRVIQPLGVYYVTVLPARVLLSVAFSHALSATLRDDEDAYDLDGTQRLVQPRRLQLIADYINRTDAAFPNSIILAANFRQKDGLIEEEEADDSIHNEDRRVTEGPAGAISVSNRRWTVSDQNDGCSILHIPTREKMAAIIDGQHRLFAFASAQADRLDMNLICSVFLDLPKPFQAQLFATINSTQKPVDKSLTYELFGYNIDEEPEDYWSPDKLAVLLTRKLATDAKSPLKGKIIIAPQKDEALKTLTTGASWKVSTAVVVEGIMRLFTSNPKKDTTDLLAGERKTRSALAAMRKDRSPLRKAYLANEDAVIYTLTLNYLLACDQTFWATANAESFITRTVGVQALFDVLRRLALAAYEEKDISADRFLNILRPAGNIDFSSEVFRNASGSGRSAIRNALLDSIGIPAARRT